MGVGLTITRDELENELAGRPTLNQRHRVMTYVRLRDRRRPENALTAQDTSVSRIPLSSARLE